MAVEPSRKGPGYYGGYSLYRKPAAASGGGLGAPTAGTHRGDAGAAGGTSSSYMNFASYNSDWMSPISGNGTVAAAAEVQSAFALPFFASLFNMQHLYGSSTTHSRANERSEVPKQLPSVGSTAPVEAKVNPTAGSSSSFAAPLPLGAVGVTSPQRVSHMTARTLDTEMRPLKPFPIGVGDTWSAIGDVAVTARKVLVPAHRVSAVRSLSPDGADVTKQVKSATAVLPPKPLGFQSLWRRPLLPTEKSVGLGGIAGDVEANLLDSSVTLRSVPEPPAPISMSPVSPVATFGPELQQFGPRDNLETPEGAMASPSILSPLTPDSAEGFVVASATAASATGASANNSIFSALVVPTSATQGEGPVIALTQEKRSVVFAEQSKGLFRKSDSRTSSPSPRSATHNDEDNEAYESLMTALRDVLATVSGEGVAIGGFSATSSSATASGPGLRVGSGGARGNGAPGLFPFKRSGVDDGEGRTPISIASDLVESMSLSSVNWSDTLWRRGKRPSAGADTEVGWDTVLQAQ